MPLSTDVNLPKKHKAKFPDRCVVCGAESPGSSVRLITHSVGWWTVVTLFFGMPFSVKAPACSGCGWMLQGKRLASLLITILLFWVSLQYLWPYLKDEVPLSVRKWVSVGLGLVCVGPYFVYELFFPHPFNLTAHGDNVDYEFRDPEMAYEFAELNEDAEWVRIS